MDDLSRTAEYGRFYDLPFIGMAVASTSTRRWLRVNDALCDLLGYTREELLARTFTELTHPDDVAADVAAFDEVARGVRDGYRKDKRFIAKDGHVVHAMLDLVAERGPDGTVDRCYATIADVTMRTAAEERLRASSALLTNLARQVPGVIYQYLLRPDGSSGFPFASEAIAEIYEVTPAEVREDATTVFSRLHPDDLADVAATIQESARALTPWQHRYRVVLPTRGERWLDGRARPERLADGSTLWHGFITDVTEQQRAQQRLIESEERFRVQIESAPEAIVVFDVDSGRFTDANRHALTLFGLDAAAILASSPIAMSPALQPGGARSDEMAGRHIAAALEGETPVFEWVHRSTDGREIPCEVRLVRLPSASHRLVRGSITDISERKRAQAELLRLNAAIASSLNGIAISELDGRLTYVNQALLAMWGYRDASQVLGRFAREFWASGAQADAVHARLLATGGDSGEMTAPRVDGSVGTFQYTANVFHDADGTPVGMLAAFVDVTDAKRMQSQLLQSQKIQTVGRLAGGVAHDFNNLLTVMKGYLDLVRLELGAGHAVYPDLAEVDRAIESATGLTQQLLAFSRKQIIHPRVLDLNESVTRMHAMLSRLLGEDIELRLRTAPDLGLVRFDPTQAEQILVNLAVNARDAMPNGGILTIETSNVILDTRYRERHPETDPGEHILLAVSDTGTGMTEEVRSHLFEPFFTTKEPGRGTGLGLPMVFGAVSQNKGRIEVYSEVDHGTTFKIYLPRVNADESPRISPSTGTLPHGTERIAVVEDEDAIRALAVRVLSGLGYEVLAFRTGAAALKALEPMTERIDLVLTDVVMPEMKGRELADRLRAIRPDLRILFASGYTEDVISKHGVLHADADFLPKPYSPAILARRVRAALDRPASS